MAPESAAENGPRDEPESFVGLSADEARTRAYAQGWTTVRTLPPDAIITMEFLSGRLNFTVDEASGAVQRSWAG